MIPLTTLDCQSDSWKKLLAGAIRDPAELLRRLALSPADLPPLADKTLDEFPLRVPEPYLNRIKKGDPQDPLLRQVLALQEESLASTDFLLDPVGDGAATTYPGLLQKYAGRALIITTGACPIHCRYCFRRHFPYSEARSQETHWEGMMEHLQSQTEVEEIILSGGDPLSLSNERLEQLSRNLARIPHLQRLRIHTRMPVVIPQRVDTGLLDWLKDLPWATSMVLHSNHGREIDEDVAQSMAALRSAGVHLLNQAVLLRGVNDQAPALINLSTRLFEVGILPYYLHMLDPVQGAAHFHVAEAEALRLMESLRRQLPGYLVPRLVREQAGHPYKSPLAPVENI